MDGLIGWLDDQGPNVAGMVAVVVDKDGSMFLGVTAGFPPAATADALYQAGDAILGINRQEREP